MKKYFWILFASLLVTSGANAATAKLSIGTMTGTFPTYTDVRGITVTYTNGSIVGGAGSNGLSTDTGGVPHSGRLSRVIPRISQSRTRALVIRSASISPERLR